MIHSATLLLDFPLALQMDVVRSSEIEVNFYRTAQCHITKDSTLHRHHCQNVKSDLVKCVWSVINIYTVTI
jgi:hypothetical protein